MLRLPLSENSPGDAKPFEIKPSHSFQQYRSRAPAKSAFTAHLSLDTASMRSWPRSSVVTRNMPLALSFLPLPYLLIVMGTRNCRRGGARVVVSDGANDREAAVQPDIDMRGQASPRRVLAFSAALSIPLRAALVRFEKLPLRPMTAQRLLPL